MSFRVIWENLGMGAGFALESSILEPKTDRYSEFLRIYRDFSEFMSNLLHAKNINYSIS